MRGDKRLILAIGLVTLFVGLTIASMDPSFRDKATDRLGYDGRHSDNHAGMRHLFHSGADIRGEKKGETYAQFDARRDRSSTEGFMGFGCVESCADLEAGYRWGQRNNVKSAKACRGDSWSFLEGCVGFATTERVE